MSDSFFRTSEYRVHVAGDDWVAPEETLIDSSSDYSDLEQPIGVGVFRFALGAAIVAALAVAGGAFRLAVSRHDYFAALAFRNATVNFTVTPPRGIILDRQGKPLVVNIPSFDLLAVSRELPKDPDARQSQFAAIADILGKPVGDIVDIAGDNAKKSPVFFLAEDMSKDQVLAVKRLNPAGVSVITTTKRSYVNANQFSTIIGYTGNVAKSDLARDAYYLPSDGIGRWGIEAEYEEALRGKHGRMYFTRGEEGAGVADEPPVQGHSVVLNVDYDAQKTLYNALYGILREANVSNAAAIVQDPRTGAVLAMVSFPGYDNNVFNSQVSEAEFKRLFESKSRPLFNRVISGLYNPGSTIKPFIGMTALQERVVSPSDTIQDCVSISLPNPSNPDDPYVFHNWRPDFGAFNLRRAIANSCNIYFFTIGGGFGDRIGLGAERIVRYLKKGLADAVLGIDLPGEAHGFLPTPDWKLATRHENWYQGDTYNISIGQGDMSVTPLWINSYISAVANGGTIWKPRIAGRVMDADKRDVAVFPPTALGQLPFSKDIIAEMRRDMRETVLTGTAHLLQDVPVAVAAKTGTAEVTGGRTINSLFTAFAPLDNPEVAITVLVEGSPSNEGYAIRTADTFLKWYFTK